MQPGANGQIWSINLSLYPTNLTSIHKSQINCCRRLQLHLKLHTSISVPQCSTVWCTPISTLVVLAQIALLLLAAHLLAS